MNDLLRAGRSEVRSPVGAKFSAFVRAGPGFYPASRTLGTGSFSEVKWPGRGVSHASHLAQRLKKE